MSDVLPAVQRPNGKLYQPRKVVAQLVGDEYDGITDVLVFGTHDPDAARPLADAEAKSYDRGFRVAGYRKGWWRDGFDYGRRFISDPKRGRAGLMFEVVEG